MLFQLSLEWYSTSENSNIANFTEKCHKALIAPKMERDLLEVGDSMLAEATSYQDFAAITTVEAVGHNLVCVGCTHLPSLEIKESNYYWQTPVEAKAHGKSVAELTNL